MNARGRDTFSTALPPLLLLVLFSLLVFPPIFAGAGGTGAELDQDTAHLPQIDHFVRHPRDWLDYEAKTATTPGHHVVLAGVARLLGVESVTAETRGVRIANALFGHALLLFVWLVMYRVSGSPWRAVLFALPVACSSYVQAASIWIVTDNGALLFYAAALWMALGPETRPRPGLRAVLAGLAATLMVWWRQMYLPVVGAAGLCAMPSSGGLGRRVRYLVPMLGPLLVMALYAREWGGITPPVMSHYARVEPAVPLHALALVGLFGFAYGPYLAGGFSSAWRSEMRALPRGTLGRVTLVAALLAVPGLWYAAATTYDEPAGRWGSLVWVLARKTPVLGDRSPAVLVLALLGGAILVLMAVRAARTRPFPTEFLFLVLYLAGYSAQPYAWQRYIEPQVMVTFGALCLREPIPPRWTWLGPAGMALLFAALAQARFWGAVPQLFG